MTNLFLVPAADRRAFENLEATVRRRVPLPDLAGLSDSAISLARSVPGGVAAWGTKAGTNDITVGTWEAMERGDWVLFYFDRHFPIYGRVLVRERSPVVAKRLWGSDQEATWEYMYLLDEVREVEIPRTRAMQKLGYSEKFVPRGFLRVARNLEADFGSVEQLIIELDGEAQAAAWDLQPGQSILRQTLHQRFGGRQQGWICPSARSPNVFIFHDPESGEQHGYYDDWQADGCLHYTGEGQRGDHEMKSGNAAIFRHQADGRALRVFRGVRGTVTYEGEFELDDAVPFQRTEAPETGDGPTREVFVFRLRPKDIQPPEPDSKLTAVLTGPVRVDVPIEQQQTEKAYVNPSREPFEAERREGKLVLALEQHLLTLGHKVSRQRFLPPGEARPIITDLFDVTTGTLVEAKGSVGRDAVRMAIGQLFDYRRFFRSGELNYIAALFPREPRADLCDLLITQGIVVIYRTDAGFEDSTGGGLVNED
jgi:hypothetical protein